MSEDAQHRATEFLKELYAAGRIDEGRLDTGVAELLAARTDAEVLRWSGRCPRRSPSPARTGGSTSR